ncbi:MAG: prenyltransferase [Candidatus Helarchaeota archaeon]|nr:prenyltransferase [Candidatus Helarchaeota archaeon]
MIDLSTKFKSFLTISRAKIQIATLAHPTLGLFLACSTITDLDLFALVYFVLYMLQITFACNINCYFDYEIDQKYKTSLAQAVENLGKRTVRFILLIEGIVIGALIGVLIIYGFIIVGVIASLGFIFAIIYSATPLRVKKRGLLSAIPVIFGLYLFPVLGGWLIIANTFTIFIIIFMVGYALINEGITLVNTAEDYDEDLSENVKTWAHYFGIKTTLRLAFFFTLIGGISCIIGLFLKLIQSYILTWSFFVACGFLILTILTVSITLKDIYKVGLEPDLKQSAKKHAKKLPKWFIITRYPMLFTAIFLML